LKTTEIIFLAYVNRSGSTYLANILSGSDEILACPEADVLVREFLEDPLAEIKSPVALIERLNHYLKHDIKFSSWGLPEIEKDFCDPGTKNIDVFVALLGRYRNLVKPAVSKILFKAERLIFLFDQLAGIKDHWFSFRFVSIVRDPRAICHSQRNTLIPETGKPMTNNLVYTCLYWNRHTSMVKKLILELPLFLVKFEDLVQQFIPVMNKLTVFLEVTGFDYNPSNGDLFDRLPLNHRDIHRQISREPLKYKTDDWRKSLGSRDTALIESVSGSVMKSMGYLTVSGEKSKPGLFAFTVYYRLRYALRNMADMLAYHLKKIF
jgi:hypothetical protein